MSATRGVTVRNCALPGCARNIETLPGRPQRRYCCAAHRAEARRVRVQGLDAAAHPGLASPPDADLPTMPDTAPARPLSPSFSAPPPLPGPGPSKAARDETTSLLKRRAVAMLGAFGILAGGGSWIASHAASVETVPVASAPPENTSTVDPVTWAAQASSLLDSIDRQLDLISQTEQLWAETPMARVFNHLPVEVQALLARKSTLEQQRTVLRTQLAEYHTAGTVAEDLVTAQRQLSELERTLKSDASESAELRRQLEEVRSQRDAKLRELSMLNSGVQEAARTPLSDNADRTASVVRGVADLTGDPERARRELSRRPHSAPGERWGSGQRPEQGERSRPTEGTKLREPNAVPEQAPEQRVGGHGITPAEPPPPASPPKIGERSEPQGPAEQVPPNGEAPPADQLPPLTPEQKAAQDETRMKLVAQATKLEADSRAKQTAPAAKPAVRPGAEPGSRPGAEAGSRPDSEPAARPGAEQEARPGKEAGARPEVEPGARPGTEPGAELGARPEVQPGTSPGAGPGAEPAVRPGAEPGARPEVQPETGPGARPQPEPEARPGGSSAPAGETRTEPNGKYTTKPGEAPGKYQAGDAGASPRKHSSDAAKQEPKREKYRTEKDDDESPSKYRSSRPEDRSESRRERSRDSEDSDRSSRSDSDDSGDSDGDSGGDSDD
ncbi:hypothetical protein GCM10023321_38750 [Pseudonocardia eucalypti]|uniref:Uncharacterized protein n=1 Tax=Pseudonocardia eucalypti TaxID=648755 RepID=A0ABP9QBM5_9PSEU|nr:hypothetical protein [Pseudonocardia eucalypti]